MRLKRICSLTPLFGPHCSGPHCSDPIVPLTTFSGGVPLAIALYTPQDASFATKRFSVDRNATDFTFAEMIPQRRRAGVAHC